MAYSNNYNEIFKAALSLSSGERAMLAEHILKRLHFSQLSEPSIIPALIGMIVAGILLIYTLDKKHIIVSFCNQIDKDRIIVASLFFLCSPFLFTYLSIHTFPGALQSILPVITFILGQMITEKRSQNDLIAKEKAIILELNEKFSINWEKYGSNKRQLDYKLRHKFKYPPCEVFLEEFENVNSELGKLTSFQGVIEEDKRLATDSTIISARSAARCIEEFNRELKTRKDYKDKVESANEPFKNVSYQAELDELDKKILGILIGFDESYNDFQKSLCKIPNIWL